MLYMRNITGILCGHVFIHLKHDIHYLQLKQHRLNYVKHLCFQETSVIIAYIPH